LYTFIGIQVFIVVISFLIIIISEEFMSGHSKWSTIKHKKAALDAKRGKVFTKIIKELMVAAKTGGSDSDSNPRLRQAISTAKASNMPNDTMTRAIQKGAGELEGVNYEETSYEGYGPGGVAIMMDIMTDNKNRTVAEIRHLMSKYGGNLGENGSVSWMFEKLGQITLSDNSNEEKAFNHALEFGADDFNAVENTFVIAASPSETVNIAEVMAEKGYEVISSTVEMVPKNMMKVSGDRVKKLISLLNLLEEHDDIQNIYSNVEFDEADL
jgi:YebC/PmpR family DNA-binding regulatory protein